MADFALTMARGDGRTIKIVATYPEAIPEQNIAVGDPYSLAGKTVYFTARKAYKEKITTLPLIAKTSLASGGITVRATPNTHIADIVLVSDDTEALTVSVLNFDVRAQVAGGEPITIAEGTLTIRGNATRL